jgi:hypothetical protein
MPQHLVYDMKTIKEMIVEREAKGLMLEPRLRKMPSLWLNQDPSWYCWCYAVVHGCMCRLVIQNEPFRRLVPESVAGPIKNYQKQGGLGYQAADYIRKNGVADASAWPWTSHTQANKRSYFEPSRENAALTKITEDGWWDLETIEEKASCLLRNIIVACGYNDMGHEMLSVDPILKNGEVGSLELDSYAKNGKYNTRTRVGRDFYGEDMIAIHSITPNSLPATT